MQAFNSVNRRDVHEISKDCEVPEKLIKVTLTNALTKVKISDNDFSEYFKLNTGFRIGDSLSAILFRTVIDKTKN